MWPQTERLGGRTLSLPQAHPEDLVTSSHPHLGNGAKALSTPVLTQGLQGGLQPKIDLVLLLSLRKERRSEPACPFARSWACSALGA